MENELRQKMVNLNESIDAHEKIHLAMEEASNKPQNAPMNGVSIEQMENLKEQLASQSQQIEQMQQNQTLLHELRGQIHFLEAKVEQRAKLLESALQTTSPSQSDTDISSPCGSQGSPLQMPCEDGYEMSPRSIHWLEIRRLEEKIGRLARVDEELVRRNRELEGQAKKLKGQLCELQLENAVLQERLSEELVQVSVLRSHMEEGKHRGCSTPQKSALQAALQKEVQKNKGLVAEVKELQEDLYAFRQEIREKENMIEMLQNKVVETKLKHPEHDDKVRLEAELEALSKEVEDQKAAEEDLKVIMKQMEMNFKGSERDLELQIDQWKAKFEDSEKSHHTEVTDLRRRMKILSKKKSSKGLEDIDIAEVQRQIMEASSAFGTEDSEVYANLVYDLVKRAVDAKISLMAKKSKDSINEINETWKTKIKTQLNNNNRKHCEKLEKENILLQEKFAEHSQRLSSEKDAQWGAKLKDIENSARLELKNNYENEIANLKLSLDNASKERSSAEAKSSTLSRQVKDLKKKFQGQKTEMVKEFENKLSLIEKELKDGKDVEMGQRQEIERLRDDFQSQLQREKNLEERHRKEVANLHKFFEAKWVDEMKKIQKQVQEVNNALNSSNEKLKVMNQKNIEMNYQLMSEASKVHSLELCIEKEKHTSSLMEENLRNKFLESKKFIKILKADHEKQIQDVSSALNSSKEKLKLMDQEKLEMNNQLMLEASKVHSLEHCIEKEKQTSSLMKDKLKKKCAELEELIKVLQKENKSKEAHRKEIENLRQDLEAKLRVEEGKRKSLEVAYLRQVEKINEMMRDTSNNRTATPSSEMTSPDDTCSSCQEDMLPGNKHLLVNKIHQDGKRVLQLIESCQVPSSTEKEARLWLEERKWIVNKIRNITPEIIENQTNLKLVISNLVEELLNARQRLILSCEEINGSKERFSELERQLDYERSKVSVLENNLSHQLQLFRQYESQLDSKSNEVMLLKKILAYEASLYRLNSSEKASQRVSENLTMSYDVGCLRSADVPRSAEQFFAFSPELGNPSPFKITEVEAPVHLTPQLHFRDETDCPDAPDNVFHESTNGVSTLEEELMNRLSDAQNNQSDHAKLHCLYLIYMRSLSYNKSLVYQKKYLIQLLRGFQATETATLAWLNNQLPHVVEDDSSIMETRLQGRSRFRSVGFLVVATIRMKYLVKRWALRALVPSNNRVDAEIRKVFRSRSTPTNTPGSHNLSSISLSNSIGRREAANQITTNSRHF